MSTPVPTNPNPFVDPNNALRQFNQYFGDLRKQYGEDVIRKVGFEPKEFQALQASLRKLQLDPRATPEQHREAYMQARDTLARRLTTPLEATRSYSMVQQPKPAPSPSVGNDGIVTPMPVERPVMNSPTQEQLYAYARAVGRGETGQWDPARGTFVMTGKPEQPPLPPKLPETQIPQPPAGGLTQAAPFDVAAAYRQNSQKLADAVKAGQITVERARQLQAPLFAATKLGSTPEGQAAMNAAAAQAQGGMPMSGYDAAAQYRNFGQELMGMIKSGALTVEQANALKAPVFNAVKLGNSNAGYQQMQAALNAARQQMGGQNMGQSVNPVTQPQEIVVTGQRMPEIVAPPPPPQPPMPVMPPPPVVYDTFRPETQPPMPERHSEYGIPLWMQLGAGPERDAAYAQYMKAQRGEMQPKFIGKNFTGDAPPPGKKYIETPEGLVPVPINDVPVKPAMGPGLGGSLGMPMQGVGMAPQMPMPYNPINTTRLEDIRGRPGSGMGIGAFLGSPGQAIQGGGMMPQLAEMLNPQPRQGSFVDTMPKMITDDNFRFGETPQVKAPNAQGMAMGGLLRKYYGGGMC